MSQRKGLTWIALLVFGLLCLPQASAGPERAGRLKQFTFGWLGTPYRWGGTNRLGIDCSAFLRQMYRDVFDLSLPRTTKQQIHLGLDLSINLDSPAEGLEPGDLIFFINRSGVPYHVVTYIGDGQIAHSESGRGVVIDPMSRIWGKRVVARRYLVPRKNAGLGFFAVPPSISPIVPKEIPCPSSIEAVPAEVLKYSSQEILDFSKFGERSTCEFRALAAALSGSTGKSGKMNASKIKAHVDWLQKIEELQSELGRGF